MAFSPHVITSDLETGKVNVRGAGFGVEGVGGGGGAKTNALA